MKEERYVVPTAEWLLIDKNGNGFSSRTGKPYKPEILHDGYIRYCATVNGKSCRMRAHRAVALVFLDNPDNLPTVNHKNGIKSDNRLSNLEWSDLSYQQRHSVVKGLKINTKRGKDSNLSKHSEETIHRICKLLQDGYRNCDIKKLIPEVNIKTISNIRLGKSWTHISCHYNYPTSRKKTYSKETIEWIIDRFHEGMSPEDIAKETCNKYISIEDIKSIIKNN